MNIWSLFVVASMPIVQVLLIALLGAFLASGYLNILTPSALRDMNKVVYMAFTPSLLFVSIARAVTPQNIVSWWFMPINLIISSVAGAFLGWIIVKILKPPSYLRGLVVSSCCATNWGNIMLVLVPAICNERENPFGESSTCSTKALSYASLSAALGSFLVWTYGYSLMKNAGAEYEKFRNQNEALITKENGNSSEGNHVAYLNGKESTINGDEENQTTVPLLSGGDFKNEKHKSFLVKIKEAFLQILQEFLMPANIGAIVGFVVGLIPWLKSLLIGSSAPLEVIEDSIKLLSDGTIPALTLILGGNLTKGLKKSSLNKWVMISLIIARYVILPVIGMAVVVGAGKAGFLPANDNLYKYILLLQFSMPPAMNIGTMAQLFHVGQEECSMIFLWTYLAAAPMITIWSTIYLWILE